MSNIDIFVQSSIFGAGFIFGGVAMILISFMVFAVCSGIFMGLTGKGRKHE